MVSAAQPPTIQIGHQAAVARSARAPRRGWFAQRWGRLVALAIGLVLLSAAVKLPWLSVDLSVADPFDTPPTVQSSTVETSMLDVQPWGLIFLVCAIVGAVASLAAVLAAPGRVGAVLGAVGVVALGCAAAGVGAAWAKIWALHDETAAHTLDLVRMLGFTAPLEGGQRISFLVNAEGAGWAWWGLIVLGLVAAVTLRPAAAPALVAGVGTVLALLPVVLPYFVVHTISVDAVSLELVWWPRLGAPGYLTAGGVLASTALVWWSLARPRPRGRHTRLVATVLVVLATAVASGMVGRDARDWFSMVGLLDVEVATASMTESLFTLGVILLWVAAFLAWRRARVTGTRSTVDQAAATVTAA